MPPHQDHETVGKLLPSYKSNGFKIIKPGNPEKSETLRVTSTQSCTSAVAAMMASGNFIRRVWRSAITKQRASQASKEGLGHLTNGLRKISILTAKPFLITFLAQKSDKTPGKEPILPMNTSFGTDALEC